MWTVIYLETRFKGFFSRRAIEEGSGLESWFTMIVFCLLYLVSLLFMHLVCVKLHHVTA